ncbi:MAG: DUF5103 domain-containing protein [Bacteroidales bacterium]|jgi:hypothetical protein|nr:DUF5103 domain-containing protein [Bacteroidales bacterium]
MYIKFIYILTIFFSIFIPKSLFSINKDTLICEDKIYSERLKSVRIHVEGEELTYPIIELNAGQNISFNFDQIGSNPDDYYYTIIHCSSEWKPSNLFFFEYATGFEENQIRNYSDSHSTFVQYTHYDLLIPNDDIQCKLSGNYLLVVYTKNGDLETIVCTKRFMIFETLIEVGGNLHSVVNSLYRKTSQKLDFEINYKNFEIYIPENEIKPVILQNYQWNNAIYNIKPSFLDNENIVYDWEEKTMFQAANEYRTFDIINLEMMGEHVENLEFKDPYYYVDLENDKSKLDSKYSKYKDFNGKFGIRTKRFKNNDYPEIQADYIIVKFSLSYNVPLYNTNIYIYGELTDYELNENNKMIYNEKTRCYEKLLFLKQGYYNYRYVAKNTETGKIDHTFFEGSFFETENDYLLLIYYRNPRYSYDKLINFSIYNSANGLIKN